MQKIAKRQPPYTFRGGRSTAVDSRCAQVGAIPADDIGPAEKGSALPPRRRWKEIDGRDSISENAQYPVDMGIYVAPISRMKDNYDGGGAPDGLCILSYVPGGLIGPKQGPILRPYVP